MLQLPRLMCFPGSGVAAVMCECALAHALYLETRLPKIDDHFPRISTSEQSNERLWH